MSFEFHGWAVVRANFKVPDSLAEEIVYDKSEAVSVQKIQTYLDSEYTFQSSFLLTQGGYILNTNGFSNHYRDSPLELFEFVKEMAPGSYGLLHIRDEEDSGGWDNHFQAWVLKKGTLSRQSDQFLSPFQPEVEEL